MASPTRAGRPGSAVPPALVPPALEPTREAVLPGPADVAAAGRRLEGRIRRTPLVEIVLDGRPLLLKLENLQLSGSFKVRGALNALLAGARPQAVVTASGGNHGLGVATAAGLLGVPATVVVPATAPEGKARRISALGAVLVRHGATYAEAHAHALDVAEESGAVYVPAYDAADVVAGQGTAAAEVVAEAPDVDALVVAVGGGGLVAGTALAAGERTTWGIESEGCRALADALAAGRPVDGPDADRVGSVAASALGAARIGDVPFAVAARHHVRSALVTDEEILTARDRLWEELRLAVEPAAAAPLAAWLAGRVAGRRPCLVVCGANVDLTLS